MIATNAVPIPDQPYRPAVVQAFLDAQLEVLGRARINEAPLRVEYFAFFRRLPAWMQVVLVETQSRLKIGSREALPFERQGSQDLNGEFQPYNNTSLVATEGRGQGLVTAGHEIGHNLSWFATGDINRPRRSPASQPLSMRPSWQNALAAEQPGLRKKEDIHRGEPLYTGYRPLGLHLSLDYEPREYPEESLAEMFTHVITLLGQDVPPGKIAALLSAIHPHLWPAYGTDIEPEAICHAEQLYARRNAALAMPRFLLQQVCARENAPHSEEAITTALDIFMATRPYDIIPLHKLLSFHGAFMEDMGDLQRYAFKHRAIAQKTYPDFSFPADAEQSLFRAAPDFSAPDLARTLSRWIDCDRAMAYAATLPDCVANFKRLEGWAPSTKALEKHVIARLAAHGGKAPSSHMAWPMLFGQGRSFEDARRYVRQLGRLGAVLGIRSPDVFCRLDTALESCRRQKDVDALLDKAERITTALSAMEGNPVLKNRARAIFHDTHRSMKLQPGEALARAEAFVTSRNFSRLRDHYKGLAFTGTPTRPRKQSAVAQPVALSMAAEHKAG